MPNIQRQLPDHEGGYQQTLATQPDYGEPPLNNYDNPSQMELTYSQQDLLENLDAKKVLEVVDFAQQMEKTAKVLAQQMERINAQVEQLESQNKKLLQVNERLQEENQDQARQLRGLQKGSGVHMQTLIQENNELRRRIK